MYVPDSILTKLRSEIYIHTYICSHVKKTVIARLQEDLKNTISDVGSSNSLCQTLTVAYSHSHYNNNDNNNNNNNKALQTKYHATKILKTETDSK